MSAPFPEMPSRDPQGEAVFGQRDTSWRDIPERGTFIPSFYDPSMHPNPETIPAGGPQPFVPGFTMADVAPEFRWVYRTDGSLIDQRDFETKFMLWRRERFKYYGVRVPRGYDEKNDPIPSLRKVSRLTVDPSNPRRLRDVHFDPNATAGARADHFYTSEGEKIDRDRLEILVDQYGRDRTKLRPSERDEVERHLGRQQSSDSVGAKLGVLTELLHDGALSQEEYVRRVEALTGASSPGTAAQTGDDARTEPVEPTEDRTVVMACGKKLKDRRGIHGHKRGCKTCQSAETTKMSESSSIF